MAAAAKIGVVVVSGSLERLQMAAMIASVGAVSGNEVTVFLSMNALQHFKRGEGAPPAAEGAFGKLLVQKKAPGFKQLFQSAAELGDAKIHPCSMAMDLLDLEPAALESYISEPLGLTKFLNDCRDGQVWSF